MTDVHRIKPGQHARLTGRPDLGAGEVLRVAETYGSYQADVVFETEGGRRLETVPLERLEVVADVWERAQQGDWDPPVDFLLKQLAFQFPLLNTGGQLSNSRTDLLPHQILLTRDVVNARRRRFLGAAMHGPAHCSSGIECTGVTPPDPSAHALRPRS